VNIGKDQLSEVPEGLTDRESATRERAEKIAREQLAPWPDFLAASTPEKAQQLVHELRVHQIELELQNEELRRAQAELDAARARYFDLYDLAPVGYITVSETGLVLEANLTAARLLGAPRSALIERPLTRFILREDQDIYYRHHKALLETDEPQVCELRMINEDGTEIWALLEANAAQDIKGAPIFRVTITDISESKRAQKERQELQAQLFQSQKMEAIGQLAGGIAHDFNNILAAMIMQLDLLRLKPSVAPDTLTQTVNDLLKEANRAAKLTEQLLLFSRRQPMKTSRHDANLIILESTKLIERLLSEEIILTVDCCDEPLWVDVDAGMIENAVMNLCVNARDAMPQGGVLTITTRALELDAQAVKRRGEVRPGSFVCLRVSDTGRGMESAVVERIFEPFFTTKAPGKGKGLGLPTVDSVIAKHGGFVEVESQVGKGSTFNVFLPRVARPTATVPIRDAALAHGGNESILVVEDEPAVRRVAVLCLRQLGYRVTEAIDGLDALKIWEREGGGFDLVFSDMVMPGGLSGMDLCSRLKQKKVALRTLVTSGFSAEILDEENDTGHEVTYLPKPYNISKLAAAIRSCLDGHS
jgi:PAS domain S-box-containing protein